MNRLLLLVLCCLLPFNVWAVPYELIATGNYRDGGTVWAELISNSGEIHQVCIDRRIQSETPLKMYIGALYPTDDNAQPAPESDRSKLVLILKQLTAEAPKKHTHFIQVLKEHGVKYSNHTPH